MRFLYLLPLAFLPAVASANTCEATITAADSMTFSARSMSVPADCKEFTVHFEHTGKLPKTGMGHNWVLTRSADAAAVAAEGTKAGINNDFVPDDERVIAATPLLGGGEKATVTFDVSRLSADDQYTYFCSFPGHSAMMRGTLKLEN